MYTFLNDSTRVGFFMNISKDKECYLYFWIFPPLLHRSLFHHNLTLSVDHKYLLSSLPHPYIRKAWNVILNWGILPASGSHPWSSMEQKAPSQSPPPGVALARTPTASMPVLTPPLGRDRMTPTDYLSSCQKKEHLVSRVCVGSSPYHAVMVHPRVLHSLNTGIFNLVSFV